MAYFPNLLLDTVKSPITTTSTYSHPHQVINKVIHTSNREPKDNPFIHCFSHVFDLPFTDHVTIVQDLFQIQDSTDIIEPISPIPSISSASIGESRSLSPTSTLEDEDESWNNDFLSLTSSLTRYAEDLEKASLEVLSIKERIRELNLLETALAEQYDRKESLYLARLEEYNQILEKQTNLTRYLSNLHHDAINSLPATTATTNYPHTNLNQSQFSSKGADQFKYINSMEDKLYLLRCEISLLIGGSVGTGHIVHSFEGPENNLEYIIAGSGAITKDFVLLNHRSSTIEHLQFHKHEYTLHINQRDRNTKFTLLPRKFWTPNEHTNQCQFDSCSTCFTFFNRRHHCRRCGILVCQRHSLNRLPLFSKVTRERVSQWYRICDSCFYDLIIRKGTPDSATQLSEIY